MNVVLDVTLGKVDASALSAAVDSAIATTGKTATARAPTMPEVAGTKGREGLMSYHALTAPVEKMMVGLSTSITSAMKNAGLGSAAGGAGAILQLALGESLDQIVNILQSIVKVLMLIAGIGIVIKIISDVIGAFWRTFQSVTKVWDMLLSVLSKMVEPFANLLIPLMLPFLYLFTSIGRILNLMLLPVFTLMMKAMATTGSGVATAATQFLKGDISGGIQTMITAFGKALGGIKEQLVSVLSPLFDMLASWIRGFLTMDFSGIHETLVNLLGKDLGGALNFIIDALYKGASAIMGFIAQFVGQETFDKFLGKGSFENIEKTNTGFKAGIDIAKSLQDIWNIFTDLLGVLQGNPPGKLWEDVNSLVTNVKNAVDGILNGLPGGDILKTHWDDFIATLQSWLKAMKEVYLSLFGEGGTGGEWGKVKSSLPTLTGAIVGLANAIKALDISSMVNRAISSAVSVAAGIAAASVAPGVATVNILSDAMQGVTRAVKSATGVKSDFIMRPGGSAVSFSPGDTIIGTANPASLGGGGGNTYNINIYGNGERYIADAVQKGIEQVNARTSRNGFYQKGY